MSESNIKAIILVAGMGTRLRPYTNDRPKCLVEVNKESLLDSQLKIFQTASITNITIVGGYRADMLKRKNIELIVNDHYDKTNMVHSLFCAEKALSGECIISYGDIVYSNKILQELVKSNCDITVIIDKNWQSYWEARSSNPLDDAETLKLSNNNLITEIGNTPNSLNEIDGQYIGLMKFSDKGLQQLKLLYRTLCNNGSCMGKPIDKAYMTDLLQEAINAGIRVNALPTYNEWIEVDTVSDLLNETTINRHAAIMQDASQ